MCLAAQIVGLEETSRGSGGQAFEMGMKNAPEHDKRVARDNAPKIRNRRAANGRRKRRKNGSPIV